MFGMNKIRLANKAKLKELRGKIASITPLDLKVYGNTREDFVQFVVDHPELVRKVK